MRSILPQGRRTGSRALLPRLPSTSSSSALPRRFNFSTSTSNSSTSTSSSLQPSARPTPPILEPPPPLSSSPLPSTQLPPPPLHVRSSSPPTISPPSTSKSTAPSPNTSSKPFWLNQGQIDNHQAKAVALAARLEAEGSVAVLGTPEFFEQVRPLFNRVSRLPRTTDDHLRALSTIHHAISTSSAAVEDEGRRKWIRSTLSRLLYFFTRRPDPKSDVYLSSLRLVLQAGPADLDLFLTRDAFRNLAVRLASGAKDASEAVEIVEGLRRLSPSSFMEVEFEEVLQAIGRVEDWTTTTPAHFQLPFFPAPFTPSVQSRPPSSSNSTPPAPPRSSPTPPPLSTLPREKKESSPPPSRIQRTATPSRLLQFSRILQTTPPPSNQDVETAFNLYKAAYPQLERITIPEKTEILLRMLAYANRAPPSPDPKDKNRFAGIVASLVATMLDLRPLAPLSLKELGLDLKDNLLPLLSRLDSRSRVRTLVYVFHGTQRREFEPDESEIIWAAMNRFPGQLTPRIKSMYEDWETGFAVRLEEVMEQSATRLREKEQTGTDEMWLVRTEEDLRDPEVPRGRAFGALQSRDVGTSSSDRSLVLATDLYSRYAPTRRPPPLNWRQQADALVRVLLVFTNLQGPTPPFGLLAPILRDLGRCPSAFIPSTPSIPSFAIPLLPIATNLSESLLIVNTFLHAQKSNSDAFSQLWTAFLSSIEQHPSPSSPVLIISSELFDLVDKSPSSEPGYALEDLIQLYLRRRRRVGGGKAEERTFETLERVVQVQKEEEGEKWGSSMFGTLMEVQVVVRKNWKEVFSLWEEARKGPGVDAKSVEMFLLACLNTSSVDRAKAFITTVRSDPSKLPLLTPRISSIYNSLLLQAKDLPSLVDSIAFQASASTKEEDASTPLAVEDLAAVIRLAREIGGDEGRKPELRLKDAVGKEVFEEVEQKVEGEAAGRS